MIFEHFFKQLNRKLDFLLKITQIKKNTLCSTKATTHYHWLKIRALLLANIVILAINLHKSQYCQHI